MLPQALFWLGLISIPFAWLVWYFGPGIEMVRPVLASINDPASSDARRSCFLFCECLQRPNCAVVHARRSNFLAI